VKRRKDLSLDENRELVLHLVELADAAHASEIDLMKSLTHLDFAYELINGSALESAITDTKGKQKVYSSY